LINSINNSIEWAVSNNIHVVYIRHENLSAGTRNLKPNTFGSELAVDLNVVSDNIFTKYKSNALTSSEFTDFINKNEVCDFYITGSDATVCVKSTCFNLRKASYDVAVLSDCITSWDKKKIPEMLAYYESKGCKTLSLSALLGSANE
jgi:nicotinamidase-related amidase